MLLLLLLLLLLLCVLCVCERARFSVLARHGCLCVFVGGVRARRRLRERGGRAEFQVNSFGGKKTLVVSTVSFLGGKNNFLGVAYMVVGALCIGLSLLFLVKQRLHGRQPGDTASLRWPEPR